VGHCAEGRQEVEPVPDGPDVAVNICLVRGSGRAVTVDGAVDPRLVVPSPHRLWHRRPAVPIDGAARSTPVCCGCGGVAGRGPDDGAVVVSAPTGDVDTEYVIRRGGELRTMAHTRRDAANAAEKVALLAAEVADDLGRYADQDDALTLHAIALALLARAYIALAALLGEPYVIGGEPRNGAVL
jgi:hypothetical protein